MFWDPIIDVGEPESRRHLQPAPSAEVYRARLHAGELTFSNSSDRELVGDMYERTLRVAFASVKLLKRESGGWGDAAEVERLCAVVLGDQACFPDYGEHVSNFGGDA